ncbi:MAG: DUF190 domain-containing protein [Pseudomonadota bacterium]
MRLFGEAELLRIYIGEDDKHQGRPLSEAIVEAARVQGLAGATVLRGLAGFGANSVVHTSKILRLSADLPLVIEIVDILEKIQDFLPSLHAMIKEGMITLETVRVFAYRHNRGEKA